MANPLDVVEICLDLIAAAKGLPPGSIKPGDLTVDELYQEAKDLMEVITVASWGLVGVTNVLKLEHDKGTRDISENIPRILHSFPLSNYYKWGTILGKVVDHKYPLRPYVYPEVYFHALKTGAAGIADNERGVMLGLALALHYGPSRTRDLVYGYTRHKNESQLLADAYIEAIKKMTARREDLIDAYPDDGETDDPGDVAELDPGE